MPLGDPAAGPHPQHRPREIVGRFGPVRGQVEIIWPVECFASRLGGGDTADAVGTDRGPVPSDQVPGARFQYQAERIEAPLHHLVLAQVAHREPAIVPERIGDRRQRGRLLRAMEPAGRVDMHPLGDSRCPAAQFGRQCGEHLELRRREHGAEAEIGCGGG